VEDALDAAERDRKVRRRQLQRRYSELRAPGRNGIGAMTQILSGRDAVARVPRSVLERNIRRALRRRKLPAPTPRFVLRLPDRTVEFDLAFADLKLGIELDGHGAHATRRQRAADHERHNAVGDAHWTLRRYTFEQVVFDLDGVIRSIRSALVSAGYRL
jgi:very-short-patch-repair endonuclease